MDFQTLLLIALLAIGLSVLFGVVLVYSIRRSELRSQSYGNALSQLGTELREAKAEFGSARAELGYTREYLDERLDQVNRAVIKNSNLWLDANHLVIEAQTNKTPQELPPAKFLERLGIDQAAIEQRNHQVFVLMPFLKSFNPTWETIATVCRKNIWTVLRSDDEVSPGSFLSKIVARILESGIIICDISNRNPNVFYELGIAHALNKYVILTAKQQSLSNMPVDLSANDIVLYQNLDELSQKLSAALEAARVQLFTENKK